MGIGLGSGSISGVFGRILGGSFCDSKFWGRRRTLLLSAIISAVACFLLAAANDFSSLVVANLLMGFGVGLSCRNGNSGGGFRRGRTATGGFCFDATG